MREIRRDFGPFPVQTGSEPRFDLEPFISIAKGVFSPNLSFLALTVADLGLLGGGKAILEQCAGGGAAVFSFLGGKLSAISKTLR